MPKNEYQAALGTMLQLSRPIQVVDVGANPIGGDAPYAELLRHGLCEVIGFEPQTEALQRLNENKSPNETYLPYAIGIGETHTFNICHHRGWSSTLTPSASTLEIFSSYKDNARIVAQAQIETRKLDEVSEIARVDLLKIDIQGGELDVFRHGATKLETAVAIQTEVVFVNLYDGQPEFG